MLLRNKKSKNTIVLLYVDTSAGNYPRKKFKHGETKVFTYNKTYQIKIYIKNN